MTELFFMDLRQTFGFDRKFEHCGVIFPTNVGLFTDTLLYFFVFLPFLGINKAFKMLDLEACMFDLED